MWPAHFIFLDLITLIVFGKGYKYNFIQISAASYDFLSLTSKYSPQQPVLKHLNVWAILPLSKIIL
jgi:predicted membrane protein